jgi:hypothetical protein
MTLKTIFPNGNGGYSPRNVHVRRKGYFDILKKLTEENFFSTNTTVIGDIFELDLALPHELGYNIIQIDNGSTPKHEKNYMTKDHNFVSNLEELREVLEL